MKEQGTAAIELALGILVLVIPIAVLVLSFGPTLERRVLARSLATETARVVALAEGDVSVRERDRLLNMVRGSGIAPGSVRVGVCGSRPRPVSEVVGCMLQGQAEVSVIVEVVVQPQMLPGGPEIVSYRHTEPLDPYRSRG